MTFKTQMKIHFDEADPAGIAFSGGLFTKIHRCYEDFIEALGEDPQKFFLEPELIYPLRRFEVDYHRPLLPLRTYDVEIGVIEISNSSFQLQYQVLAQGQSMAVFRSVHVAVNKADFQKTKISDSLRQNLEKFEIQQ